MPKLNPQQKAQAGEHLVAAEIHRRGGYAVTFSGNMPQIDLLASDVEQERTVTIQVKTMSGVKWQASTAIGKPRTEQPAESHFWVLVDIGTEPGRAADFWIIPQWWLENHVHEEFEAYKARHGGARPKNPASTHWAIEPDEVAEWRDRWEVLGITPEWL